MYRYRIEFVKGDEYSEHEIIYEAAFNIADLIKRFRKSFDKEYRIIEVSKVIEKDWSKE